MAQPLLDFIVGRARAALPFLRGLVAQALNPTAIVNRLQEQGLSFRRQAMFDLIAALQNRAGVAQYLRITPPNTPLPTEAHALSVVNLRSNYQYVVEAVNPISGAQSYITVSSEIPLSQVQIQATADSVFLSYRDLGVREGEYELGSGRIIEANRDPGV